ncbi:MAG: hypothetical protein QF615_08720, partial [Planctomycetota bacterium]|nr:hypothetical protein [Planctomycetota bacterium]
MDKSELTSELAIFLMEMCHGRLVLCLQPLDDRVVLFLEVADQGHQFLWPVICLVVRPATRVLINLSLSVLIGLAICLDIANNAVCRLLGLRDRVWGNAVGETLGIWDTDCFDSAGLDPPSSRALGD